MEGGRDERRRGRRGERHEEKGIEGCAVEYETQLACMAQTAYITDINTSVFYRPHHCTAHINSPTPPPFTHPPTHTSTHLRLECPVPTILLINESLQSRRLTPWRPASCECPQYSMLLSAWCGLFPGTVQTSHCVRSPACCHS